MNYEYTTMLSTVRMRGPTEHEPDKAWYNALPASLVEVDAPIPPEGTGWRLVAVSLSLNNAGVPAYVVREWRRPMLAGHIEELVRIVERLRSGQFEHYDEPEDEKYSDTPRLIVLLSAIIDQVKATLQEAHQ
jgi:hypothetical protein